MIADMERNLLLPAFKRIADIEATNKSELEAGKQDTGNVTNMSWMFSECGRLESLAAGGIVNNNVSNISDIFIYDWSGNLVLGVRDTSWTECTFSPESMRSLGMTKGMYQLTILAYSADGNLLYEDSNRSFAIE